MPTNNSFKAGFDTERSRAGPFSGAFQTLGTPLAHNPVIMIFDNHSDVSIEVSVDGINTWKTFSAGEALVLDMRGNGGMAGNFTVELNTQFFVRGTAGAGSFRLSILYARPE